MTKKYLILLALLAVILDNKECKLLKKSCAGEEKCESYKLEACVDNCDHKGVCLDIIKVEGQDRKTVKQGIYGEDYYC